MNAPRRDQRHGSSVSAIRIRLPAAPDAYPSSPAANETIEESISHSTGAMSSV